MSVKVLIVDDDPLVRTGLEFVLAADDDITVVGSVGSGHDALEAAQAWRPDVALVDIRMPGMDGIELTGALRSASHPPDVLILTTFDTAEHVLGALDEGAAGFLVKSTPPREILDAVHQAAEGNATLSPEHTRLLLDRYTRAGADAATREAADRIGGLTQHEQAVVRHVTEGLSNAEIAGLLHCSVGTVKAHLAHIYAQLDVSNRVRLAILGHEAERARRRA